MKLKKILIEKITLFLEFSYKINKTRQILGIYKKIIEILKKAKLDEDSLKDPGHRLIETKGKKLTEFENNLNRIINEWYVLMNEIDKKFEESKGEDDVGDDGDNQSVTSGLSGFELPYGNSTLQPLVLPKSADVLSTDPGGLPPPTDFGASNKDIKETADQEAAQREDLRKKIEETNQRNKELAKILAQQIAQRKIEEQQKEAQKSDDALKASEERAKKALEERIKNRRASRPGTSNVENQDESVTESTSNKLTPQEFEGLFQSDKD